MPITILPRNISLGEQFGQAAGTGLAGILQGLAGQRAQKMQQQSWQDILGVTPQEAQSISQLPEPIQQQIVKDWWQKGGVQQSGGQQMAQAPGMDQQINQGMAAEQADMGQAAQQMGQQQAQIAGQQQPPVSSIAQRLSTPPAREQRAIEDINLKRRRAEQADRKIDIQEQKMERTARNEEGKQRLERFKYSKNLRENVLEQGDQAQARLDDLKRIEELEKEGLEGPGYDALLERSGFDIPALRNPASQEFNKIAANFIRDARNIFGSRVTNFELESFLQTIPDLSQSPEGRKRVIANLKTIARTQKARSQAMKDIIRANDGDVPLDLAEQLSDRMSKIREKNAAKFKKDLKKEVPPAESIIKTAGGAALGSATRSLPGILSGVALGGRLGSSAGIPGILGGAALGGVAGGLGQSGLASLLKSLGTNTLV